VQTAGPDTRDEIDLAGYAHRLVARWWLIALCVAAAVGIAILQAQDSGGQRTWEGRTLVYLGQPVTPTGQPANNAPAAQPLFAQQIVRAPAAIEAAAAAAGLKPGQLAGHISIQGASGTTGTKAQPAPYVNVVVRGPWGAKQAAAASQSLADEIVKQGGAYQSDKRTRLEGQVDYLDSRIKSILDDRDNQRQRIENVQDDPNISDTDKLIAITSANAIIQSSQTLEFQLSQQLLDAQSQLSSVSFNEEPRVISPARGSRVDVTSRQANLVVAVILGLVAGVVVTLLSYVVWPAGGRPFRRRPPADADAS
jgi:hypothetical protein